MKVEEWFKDKANIVMILEIIDEERENQRILSEYLPAFRNVLTRKKNLRKSGVMQDGETK